MHLIYRYKFVSKIWLSTVGTKINTETGIYMVYGDSL